MEQIDRIRNMEQLFDFASAVMREASIPFERYEKAKEAIASLSEYYGSNEWKEDYDADEAGHLPNDLKRGVLSEDGIWNLLSDWKEFMRRMELMD